MKKFLVLVGVVILFLFGLWNYTKAAAMFWPVDGRPLARVELCGIFVEPDSVTFYQHDPALILRSSYNGQHWEEAVQIGIKYWLTDIPEPEFALYANVDGDLFCVPGTMEECDLGPVSEPYIPDLIYIGTFASSLINYDEAWSWKDEAGRTTYTVHDSSRGYWIALIPDTITYPSFDAADTVRVEDVKWILLRMGQ